MATNSFYGSLERHEFRIPQILDWISPARETGDLIGEGAESGDEMYRSSPPPVAGAIHLSGSSGESKKVNIPSVPLFLGQRTHRPAQFFPCAALAVAVEFVTAP